MLLKTAALAIALSFCALGASQALVITDFGTNTFELDDWDGLVLTSSESNLLVASEEFGSSEGSQFWGVLTTPIDIGAFSTITLTGSVSTGSFDSSFTLTLFDESFESSYQYLGNTGDFSDLSSTVTLAFESRGEGSSLISFVMFTFESPLESGFSMTLTSLDAIPEPGVPLLIGFGLGATFLLRRVRRAGSGAPALG